MERCDTFTLLFSTHYLGIEATDTDSLGLSLQVGYKAAVV